MESFLKRVGVRYYPILSSKPPKRGELTTLFKKKEASSNFDEGFSDIESGDETSNLSDNLA